MLSSIRGDCNERDLRAFGAADPVGLHGLDLFRPIEFLESGQQAVGILRDPKHPLIEFLLCDFGTAAFTAAIDDIFIRDTRLAARTPVDRHESLVCQSGFEHFYEDPLCPFVIARIGRIDFARPVIHRADLVKLALKIFHIPLRANRWVNTLLNGIVFGRRAERIPAHRVKHFESPEPFVSRPAIRQYIAPPMPDVQS